MRTHIPCSFFILTKVSVSVTFAAFIVTLLSSPNHCHSIFWAFAEFFYLLVVLKLQCVWPPRGSHLKGSLNVLVRVKLTWIINKILNERLYFGKMFEALVAQMPKCTEAVRCPNSFFFLFCLSFVSCVQLFNKTERTFGAHADPLQLSKYAYTFLCMCYFCANFSCSKQTLISLPCCHTVFSSPPVHLHTRAHKDTVHAINIWVAARFIFIHYWNILEAVQAILFIFDYCHNFSYLSV